MTTPNNNGTWISSKEFAALANDIERRVASRVLGDAAAGKQWRNTSLEVRRVQGRGGKSGARYEVKLSSLPTDLQMRWHQQQGQPGRAANSQVAVRGWTPEESARRHAELSRLATSMQGKAKRACNAVLLFHSFDATDIPASQRYAHVAAKTGVHPKTVRRWVEDCDGLDPQDWVAALAPRYPGCQVRIEVDADLLAWVKGEYFQMTKPALKAIDKRARALAPERGWRVPSYDTLKRRIQADPRWLHVAMREGPDALANMFPAQQRDYSGLALNEVWCADGRVGDVWVRFEDGEVRRPLAVGWIELRSRMFMGVIVARTESADAIRLALKAAAENSHTLPKVGLMDNGRGFASKMISGGSPRRFRFIVREEDILGILGLLGVEVQFTTPKNARAKPIESAWRQLAEMDKRFPGAYCGNRPDARPEDCDPSKAVPIERYRQALQETIDLYHATPHRGDAMNGRSPMEVYEELKHQTVLRQPTREQLRWCLLAAEKVKLDPEDHCVRILGNRYWTEKLSELSPDLEYCVRFNPEDAREPVLVCRGDQVICEAPLIEKTGFRDQAAAKDYARAKRGFKNLRVRQAKTITEMGAAAAWNQNDAGARRRLHELVMEKLQPKVVQPFRPAVDYRPVKTEQKVSVRDEVRRALIAKFARGR